MKVINYDNCYFCRTHTESIEHFFFECTIIKNIWLQIFEELDLGNKFENLRFDLETVLFGYKNKHNNHLNGINTFIVMIKTYIFGCKNKDSNVSFEAAKFFLKHQCKIHKSVTRNENEWAFVDIWFQ